MKHSEVSVVVTTYNSARFIAETLQTVLAQTCPPAEIIIVDGGSTDETLAIAAEFPVTISPQRRNNLSSCRNIGIRAASTEWVALLDHDDRWEPTKIERQLAAIRRFPDVHMVLTNYLTFGGRESTTGCLDLSEEYYRIIGREEDGYFPEVNLTDQEWLVPLTSSCLIRKRTEWFDEELHGTDDIEFFLRMMTYPFVLLNVPLARWRVSGNSLSHNDLLMQLDFIKTIHKIMRYPEKYPPGVHDCVRRIRKQRMHHASRSLLRAGRCLDSLTMFAKSFSRSIGN